MALMKLRKALMRVALLASVGAAAQVVHAAADDGVGGGAVVPLQVRGEDFVDPAGRPVRFWGVNLVSFYPPHEIADKVAENLRSRQVNLVRPHHMLRPSSDWVVNAAPIVALQDYSKDSTRTPDAEAWDRFDYLNSALRKNGIYLMLSVWWTRRYMPADVDVLQTNDADRSAWIAALEELNGWDWKKAFDVRKMLCIVDERVAALEEEFARQLLAHVNPYTGIAYGHDPQVLTLELLNEFSSEYTIICGNRFPDYFQKKLGAKWEAFARGQGIEPGDLYKPANAQATEVRAKFFRELDEQYLKRMEQVVRSTGSTVPLSFSNLWRGENSQRLAADRNGYIEDHMYADPMVVNSADDMVYKLGKTPIVGKPFIVGELNQAEGERNITKQSPTRTMLPLAASAYGSLQNWSGITFFAWLHGDKLQGDDGWAASEGRLSSLGNMIADGMQIDHLRTCGSIFRRGLLQKSTSPITIHVDEPIAVRDYNAMMRGKYTLKPGWQNVHAIRKSYGAVPESQAGAPWMTQSPASPIVSDTKQITKDIDRRQLTAAAPQAEAFSGFLDAAAPAGLKHLQLSGEGFATVVLVADDSNNLAASRRLVISRTNLSPAEAEIDGPAIVLAGMLRRGGQWQARITRPRERSGTTFELKSDDNGRLVLPEGLWHECELEFR